MAAPVSFGTLTSTPVGTENVNTRLAAIWEIEDVDADWDDDTGQIKFTASVNAANCAIRALSYHITVMAAI